MYLPSCAVTLAASPQERQNAEITGLARFFATLSCHNLKTVYHIVSINKNHHQ